MQQERRSPDGWRQRWRGHRLLLARLHSVAGVTEMIQGNTIERRDVGSSDWRTWENATRDHVQTRVDFSVSKAVGGEHGYFRPVMFLAITGNFSYGSVPGCARYSGTTVYCQWFGAQKYF